MAHQYNDPNTTLSTIDAGAPTGSQLNTFYWQKKALIEARKEQFFMPLANTIHMPKHMGKSVKVYEYFPMLDDRNINDQGIDAAGVAYAGGNLYGSSKDVGAITARLPLVGENGGRVNRVGFSRHVITGSIAKFGLFTEFTQEALDFDTDSELYGHISRELISGAVQLTEAVLQRDLLNAAGTIGYAGAAVSKATITGEGNAATVADYEDLARLTVILDNLRTPRDTKIIAGSRMEDTRTIGAARLLYIGSELIPVIRKMKDYHGNAAFIPVHQYADAGTVLNGEIGSVEHFRIIVVPEMLHFAGAGAAATSANGGYRTTTVGSEEKYNVYPMFVIGSDAFSTIGFQTSGKTTKFKIITKMPGEGVADKNDPYGEQGFMSLKWWYGTIVYKPERLAVIWTVAPI